MTRGSVAQSLGAIAVVGAIGFGTWGCGSDDAPPPSAPEPAVNSAPVPERTRDRTSVTFPSATVPTLPCNEPVCLSPSPTTASKYPR